MKIDDAVLDPVIRRWMQRDEELRELLMPSEPLSLLARRTAARHISDALAADFTAVPADGVAIEDITLETPDGELRVRRFRPEASSGVLPTQIFLHGGGFYAGTVDEIINDRLVAARCLATGVQILSVEYRLAPENPFPAAVHDAMNVVDAATHFDADPARIGIAGNSAGATIAASAALFLRDRGDSPLIHQSLEVLPGSLTPFGDSFAEYGKGFGVDDIESLPALYLGAQAAMPYVAPLDAESLEGMPEAHVLVAEFDPLRDSGLLYAERLQEAGVATTIYYGDGHVHGSVGLTAQLQIARDWQAEITREMCRVYGTSSC